MSMLTLLGIAAIALAPRADSLSRHIGRRRADGCARCRRARRRFCGEIGAFAMEGIRNVAPTAALLAFAVLTSA